MVEEQEVLYSVQVYMVEEQEVLYSVQVYMVEEQRYSTVYKYTW